MTYTLDDEISAFEAKKEQLIANHSGKFVVIYRGELFGAFDTFDRAARAALSQIHEPYLIRQVGAI